MNNIEELTQKIIKFRDERDWSQFHTPKNLAISLSLEASEVLEHFQWKTDEEINEYITTHKEHIADELGDVFNYLLLLANRADVDILKAAENKLKKNEEKYPVDKAKGNAKKYNEL
ncbi:MAG: nucleotide pyrophosphohydrolase [Candidatus Magasanikiibacteriota bacterium]